MNSIHLKQVMVNGKGISCFMHRSVKDKAAYRSVRKEVREIVITIVVIMFMLFLGILLDWLYYMRHRIAAVGDFVNWCYGWLQPYGITYTSAMDVIGGTVSIIITMVSLFLSTNINLFQRSEKNMFGITYREVQNLKKGKIQKIAKYTKRISCLAPFILILVINFKWCVTGYLLYLYCYVSVLLQYVLYASSFSRDKIPYEVVDVLLSQLSEEDDWNNDNIQRYDIRLSAVGRSIRSEGNWLEAEGLFEALLQKLSEFEEIRQQLIISHFYRIVCCDQNGNTELIHRIWYLFLRKENQKVVRNAGRGISACFLGMLQGAVYVLKEEELVIFIQEFFDFRQQGIEALSKETHNEMIKPWNVLDEALLNKRCFFMLLFLEYRFREKAPSTVELVRSVTSLKKYGNSELDKLERTEIIEDILKYVEEKHDRETMRGIISEMILDRKNGQNRCCINNLPLVY